MPNIPTGSKSTTTYIDSHNPLLTIISRRPRQTVFYTPSTVTVSEGQRVTGHVACAPNVKNNRDLDITISYQTDNDTEGTVIQYKMCVTSVLCPPLCTGIWSRLWNADRSSGPNYIIFIGILMIQFVSSFVVILTTRLLSKMLTIGTLVQHPSVFIPLQPHYTFSIYPGINLTRTIPTCDPLLALQGFGCLFGCFWSVGFSIQYTLALS
jgi:hypothetical protein